MCRLLAFASARPSSVEELIGPDQSTTYRAMARLHRDGWGTAWLEDSEDPQDPRTLVRRKRTTRSGLADDRLVQLMRRPRTRARIIHLRLATAQLAIAKRNSHPFKADGLAFAHNGTIVPNDVLRAMVGPAAMEKVRGTTDSELYFALVREGHAAGLSLGESVTQAVCRIRAAYPVASLNSVTLSADHMAVVHSASAAPAPVWTGERQLGDLMPAHHDERYYTMRHRILEDGSIVVASTGLDVEGWSELPRDSVTVIDLATMEITTSPLPYPEKEAAAGLPVPELAAALH